MNGLSGDDLGRRIHSYLICGLCFWIGLSVYIPFFLRAQAGPQADSAVELLQQLEKELQTCDSVDETCLFDQFSSELDTPTSELPVALPRHPTIGIYQEEELMDEVVIDPSSFASASLIAWDSGSIAPIKKEIPLSLLS